MVMMLNWVAESTRSGCGPKPRQVAIGVTQYVDEKQERDRPKRQRGLSR
jgi:hypothetical protein